MSDELGKFIKSRFEDRTRNYLPTRSYFFIRLDGKGFSKYTRKLNRPFDLGFMEDMNETAKYLCEKIQGAKCAFVQSDEISILMTDFENEKSSLWFDGNIQKIVSISAGLASVKFNQLRNARGQMELACFDSRVFSVPDPNWVSRVFLWRQIDCSKNSIQMLARTHFSHLDCENKNGAELQNLLLTEKSIDWNDCPDGFKRGRFIHKQTRQVEASTKVRNDGKTIQIPPHVRQEWVVVSPPSFSKDKEFLKQFIPKYKEEV